MPADPHEIDEAEFALVTAELAPLRELDDAGLRRWFGRFITRYRGAGELPPTARPPSIEAIATALLAGGQMLRHPHARQAWAREGRHARLHANGDS